MYFGEIRSPQLLAASFLAQGFGFGQGGFDVLPRGGQVAERTFRPRQAVQRLRFIKAVSAGLQNRQGLGQNFQRLLRRALRQMQIPNAEQHVSGARRIPCGAQERQRLLIKRQGCLRCVGLEIAQPLQHERFAAPVSCFTPKLERLLIRLQGFAWIFLLLFDQPNIAQDFSLFTAISQRAPERERLLLIIQSLPGFP